MRESIVVAVARNGVIGAHGGIPWKLPEDQRFFRRVTLGHAVVMGRRTFESIGRPLPGRTNLVVSGRDYSDVDGVDGFPSLDAARRHADARGIEELFVIGGEALYREALSGADRVYRTLVEADPEGDVFFPELDEAQWRCVDRDAHAVDADHAHAFSIETWLRR